jgi:hypothetical protein
VFRRVRAPDVRAHDALKRLDLSLQRPVPLDATVCGFQDGLHRRHIVDDLFCVLTKPREKCAELPARLLVSYPGRHRTAF